MKIFRWSIQSTGETVSGRLAWREPWPATRVPITVQQQTALVLIPRDGVWRWSESQLCLLMLTVMTHVRRNGIFYTRYINAHCRVKFPCTHILVMCLNMTTRNWCNCCIMEETNYNQHSYAYQLHPSPFSEKYNNNVNGTEWESETFDKHYMKLSSTVTTSPVSESQPAQVPH